MKITLVTPVLAGRSGGAEYVVCTVAEGLSEMGHSVEIVHYLDRPGTPFYPLDMSVGVCNIKPLATGRGGRFLQRVQKGLKGSLLGKLLPKLWWQAEHGPQSKWMRRYFRNYRPDLVIAFTAGSFSVVADACSAMDIPFVLSVHNTPEKEFDNPRHWDPNPEDRRRRKAALDRAAAVTVLLDEFREWFAERHQDRLHVIPNFVIPPGDFKPGKREKTIVSVGRLAEVKNHGALIEAWALLAPRYPEWRVDIYGEGPLRKALRAQVRAAGVGQSLRLNRARRDIWNVYREAAVMCHPAHFEGFGLVVLEAMIAGLPVVGKATCPGVNTLVKHSDTGILVPDSLSEPQALADALETLILDEEMRTRMGAEARLRATAWSRERTMARWAEMIAATGVQPKGWEEQAPRPAASAEIENAGGEKADVDVLKSDAA